MPVKMEHYYNIFVQLYRVNHIHKNRLLFGSHVQCFQLKTQGLPSTSQLQQDNSKY
jgi:hypothetical protein